MRYTTPSEGMRGKGGTLVSTVAPPLAVIPPFVLPDRDGRAVNTARLRGRRYAALLFIAPEDADAPEYLASLAAQAAQFARLHTEVIVVTPADAPLDALPALPFPILRDDGRVRACVLPDAAPDVQALFVTDLGGAVAAWRTARRVASLPDVETALAWAWEVARPRGGCGVVTWSPVADPPPAAPLPAPVGRFTVGTTRRPPKKY